MRRRRNPKAVVLAGPNGAGKSTAAPRLLRGALGFVNADAIARGLSAFTPETVVIEAGSVMLRGIRTLAAAHVEIALETTLGSRVMARWLAELIRSGYAFQRSDCDRVCAVSPRPKERGAMASLIHSLAP